MSDVNTPPPDVLGITSAVLGAIAAFGCMGTCVPYVGVLFMMMSMGMSVLGLTLGAISVFQRRAAQLPEGASMAGAVLNGIVLALWVLYWLFSMCLAFGVLALMLGVVAIDAA